MSDPIEALCTVLLDIAKTSPSANINDVMAQVKSALDRNTKLTNALQTDTRMLQINLGQSKGYQVLVEGNATAYIGDRYELDTDAVIKALGKLLDEIALNQSPVGTPQNLPRSGVVEFVGRDAKLIELHEQLQNNKRIAITAIAGMGGIGKTELALQYAIEQLQQGQYPAGCCWLRARDREIATDLVTFAQVHLGLSLPEQLEIEDQVRFCWQRWPEGEALVVLDNVTDYQVIAPYLPPADPRFKLLITTRLDLGSTVQKVPLEELDEDGAIALLESLVGVERVRSQLADVHALCKWVGNLPLGLELLARFLANDLDFSVKNLLDDLESMHLDADALKKLEVGMTASSGVFAALELSWTELTEMERNLACLLGLFAIAPIKWELVEQCFPGSNLKELRKARINGLMARSLLKRVGEGSYQLHQIVQEYFRIKLNGRSDLGQAIKANFWQVMVRIVQSINERPTIDQIEQVRESIAHLEEAVRSWIDSITDHDLIEPFLGVGRFYEGQGNYSFAEPWYKNCLEFTRKRLGEEHSFVAWSLYNLASIYVSQGKYEDAEPLYLSALEMYKCLFGEEHRFVATSLNNLAGLYRFQGKYEKAEPLCRSALEMRKRLLGIEHPSIASSLHDMASIYVSQGKYEKAEPLYLSALEMYKRLLGKDHLSVAESLKNLAGLYHSQRKYEEAEPLYRSALEMYKRLLGEDHPYVATSLNDLALLYRSQGKYEEAEPLYRSTLEIYKRQLGEDHPYVATSQWNLGVLYQSQGRYSEAEALYRQALPIAQSKLGSHHPHTQGILSWLNSLPQFPA
jgi:tetratricopeptide (TPR) repeat protein